MDWLGEGTYFWEAAPYRALEWARHRFGDRAAVIETHVDLGFSLNFLDARFTNGFLEVHRQAVGEIGALGHPVPRNRGRFHDLDCYVVNYYCDLYAEQHGTQFQTVRAGFRDGRPIFFRPRAF